MCEFGPSELSMVVENAALLFGDVVGEIELQDDAVALELGGQRGERVGGADGGDGGLVEGVGAGLKGIRHLADVAALDDGKQQSDLAVTAQFDAFRHDAIPIAANGGEDLRQVGAVVYDHGVALEFQRTALGARGRRKIDALAIAAGSGAGIADHEAAAGVAPARVLADGFWRPARAWWPTCV